MQPNELGKIPILEYHVITTDPAREAQFVRLADDMRADLTWLYEHNFHVVSTRELVTNTISAPAGKRPVVLTFDDATTSQFRFITNDKGELVPDPDSAVGILEAFFATHPDFGHTAHFGIIPNNCFAFPEKDQMQYCDQKITWLVDHGYEVGNHTMNHANLTDIPTETFVHEVGKPMQWMRERVGDIPENMTDVLTLPYGSFPDKDLHPDQRELMRGGFWFEGEAYYLSAAFLVGANPSVSPASNQWEPLWIPRIQVFDEEIAKWFGAFESGEVVLYVSDGSPDTVTVPDPLPHVLVGELDVEMLVADGKTVVRYDPATGNRTDGQASVPAVVTIDAVALRREGSGRGSGLPSDPGPTVAVYFAYRCRMGQIRPPTGSASRFTLLSHSNRKTAMAMASASTPTLSDKPAGERKIVVAHELGYCWGVRRALDIIEDAADPANRVAPIGDIIHNPQVVERLRTRGVEGATSVDEAKERGFHRVAITAHGMGPHLAVQADTNGMELIDTTCPLVTKVQRLAQKLVRQGYFLVVYGDDYHPEVKSVLGWANTSKACAAKKIEQLPWNAARGEQGEGKIAPPRKVALVSQTTKNIDELMVFANELQRMVMPEGGEFRLCNTICEPTTERQNALKRLAGDVDLILAIGGKKSSNTARLADVGNQMGVQSYHIERPEDIQDQWLVDVGSGNVGITAGASTPDDVIEQVVTYLAERGFTPPEGGIRPVDPDYVPAF